MINGLNLVVEVHHNKRFSFDVGTENRLLLCAVVCGDGDSSVFTKIWFIIIYYFVAIG